MNGHRCPYEESKRVKVLKALRKVLAPSEAEKL
jgi:hypothetical protein